MKKTLKNARKIMYGNMRGVFKKVTLTSDELRGGEYDSLWCVIDKRGGNLFSVNANCSDIFAAGENVTIEFINI